MSKKKIRIIFFIVVSWAVITMVMTIVDSEPYPAIAYPGFKNKGKKELIHYKLYTKEKDGIAEIKYWETPYPLARYRRFLKELYEHADSKDQVFINYVEAIKEWGRTDAQKEVVLIRMKTEINGMVVPAHLDTLKIVIQ